MRSFNCIQKFPTLCPFVTYAESLIPQNVYLMVRIFICSLLYYIDIFIQQEFY